MPQLPPIPVATDLPACAQGLSLDQKLDAIARDRAVLAALRNLARCGLREGDLLRHRDVGLFGRLGVCRAPDGPRLVVISCQGEQHPYTEDWICATR
ncbi:MAG TPA: hypothetical protein P5024_02520 [Burkholderiaceae bacterium]|jgi:hypothetical protein|nr:hypothetical protein [Burkholderiaceae bacterium]